MSEQVEVYRVRFMEGPLEISTNKNLILMMALMNRLFQKTFGRELSSYIKSFCPGKFCANCGIWKSSFIYKESICDGCLYEMDWMIQSRMNYRKKYCELLDKKEEKKKRLKTQRAQTKILLKDSEDERIELEKEVDLLHSAIELLLGGNYLTKYCPK